MKKVIIVIFAFAISLSYAQIENWERLTPETTNYADSISKVHFTDGKHGVLTKEHDIWYTDTYYTSDSGRTWIQSDTEWPERYYIQNICHSDINTLWVLVADDAPNNNANSLVYKSTNGGKNWEFVIADNVDRFSVRAIKILFPTSSTGYFFAKYSVLTIQFLEPITTVVCLVAIP